MLKRMICSLIAVVILISTVTMSVSAIDDGNMEDQMPVTYTVQDGNLIIDWTATDALYILKYAVQKGHYKRPDMPHWAYDLDQDGSVNAGDALLCLQHSVGKITVILPEVILYLE